MRLKYLLLLILTAVLTGCKKEMTQAELFDLTKSGSVLILNKFYYQLKMPNGEMIYFSGLDADGELENVTGDVDEIRKHQAVMSGTGFFIDEKGMLMTNRHVAQPVFEEAEIKKAYRSLLRSIGQYYAMLRQRMSDRYDELESSKSDCYYTDGYGYYQDGSRLAEIESQQQQLSSAYLEMEQMIEKLIRLDDPSALKISTVCQLGIAYNDTHVTGERDFLVKNPCVVVRASDKEDVDLALIQLKSKVTPENAHVFKPAEETRPLEMGQLLYMIGYNAGPTLATTQTGIQVQMTSGKVTQLSDGRRILYDIATVQGSSGSPVIDTEGNLVAVNFAKLRGSDNFNFGIPVERVKEFLNR